MQTKRITRLFLAAVLVAIPLVVIACGSPEPQPTQDINTIVSATLTAMAPVPPDSITFPPIDIPDPAPGGPTGTARVNLNVRTGPSMLFPILGTAAQEDRGEVLGVSPDTRWYAVKVPTTVVGSGTAWVSADYVDLTNPTGQALPVIIPPLLPPLLNFPVPPANSPQVSMLEAATLRSGPTLEFPVYGVAPTGARVEVLGRSEDDQWWAVRMPAAYTIDGMGWISKLYTQDSNTGGVPQIKTPDLPDDISPAAPASGAPSLITIEPLNVRTGPGTDYPSLGRVAIGSIMAVVGVSADGEFLVVNIPTQIDPGGQGWIPARYVRTENVDGVPVITPPSAP